MARFLYVCVLLPVLSACTNEQVYTAIQENQRQECAKLPQTAYEECMAQVQGSYKEYERAREDVMKETRP